MHATKSEGMQASNLQELNASENSTASKKLEEFWSKDKRKAQAGKDQESKGIRV